MENALKVTLNVNFHEHEILMFYNTVSRLLQRVFSFSTFLFERIDVLRGYGIWFSLEFVLNFRLLRF